MRTTPSVVQAVPAITTSRSRSVQRTLIEPTRRTAGIDTTLCARDIQRKASSAAHAALTTGIDSNRPSGVQQTIIADMPRLSHARSLGSGHENLSVYGSFTIGPDLYPGHLRSVSSGHCHCSANTYVSYSSSESRTMRTWLPMDAPVDGAVFARNAGGQR